ncbi:hypothetical protein IFM89_005065, partial [Coptis chinensis]
MHPSSYPGDGCHPSSKVRYGENKCVCFVNAAAEMNRKPGQVVVLVLCHTRELAYQPMEIYVDDEAKLTFTRACIVYMRLKIYILMFMLT